LGGNDLKKFISLFLVVFVFWILFTQSLKTEELLVGIVVSLIITFISKNIFDFNLIKFDLPLRIIKFLFIFLPVFVYEIIKANIQLAFIVLNPNLPVNSAIIKNKTKLKGDISKLVLANSITLTPGTLTIDVENSYYYIHTVDISSIKDEKSITGKFEKYIKGVFDD